ncbi:DUF2203 family protein [Salibacterium salarium]|uniref:DUF2203 family protein n=1 Tax=Salibacterium salarium TaxID=284579 RepID=A0A428N5K3_9BACI|nr:DUF2203 domain-containing protein [Salibacterium salarium]RSL33754.1 DUF2203 family protein [Salibacterium salarium]
MFNKYFALHEANNILPSIRESMAHLQHLQKEFKTAYHHLQAVKKGSFEDEIKNKEDIFMLEAWIDFLEIQAQHFIQQLEKHSIYVKSIDDGLVDFPARLYGKSIFLCWRQGEEYISHYHEWFETFNHRKKITLTDDD